MRTQKTQVKNFSKGILFGLFIVMVMFVTTGCPDKDKSNNARNNNNWWRQGYGYGGPGYGGNGQVGFVGIGFEMSNRAQMILEVAQQNYDANIGYGSGTAYIAGELDVSQPIPCMGGYGALEQGYYRIEPYQNSYPNMYGEYLQSATVVAYGRWGEAVLQLSNMYFFRGTMGQFDGLMGQVNVISVNGMACNTSFLVSDQVTGGY